MTARVVEQQPCREKLRPTVIARKVPRSQGRRGITREVLMSVMADAEKAVADPMAAVPNPCWIVALNSQSSIEQLLFQIDSS